MLAHPRELISALTCTVLLTACTREAPTPAAADAKLATAKTDAAPAVLRLGAAKLWREGHEDRAFALAPDGTITLVGAPYGTVSEDGELRDLEGNLMMRATPEGTVVSEGGESTGVVIHDTGGKLSAERLNIDVRFADDGKIAIEASGPNAALLGTDSPQMLSQGCTGALTRTCALITLSYLMALGNPDSGREVEANE